MYGEKRVSVEAGDAENPQKVEYRVWNPFRSKLAASVLAGAFLILQCGLVKLYNLVTKISSS